MNKSDIETLLRYWQEFYSTARFQFGGDVSEPAKLDALDTVNKILHQWLHGALEESLEIKNQ